MWSPELETLDQLLGGELPLATIRGLYPDDNSFLRAVLGLLSSGDASLITIDGADVPQWRWQELFVDGAVMDTLSDLKLKITDQGVHKVG